MAGLKLKNLKKRYGQIEVIHGIDLEIQDGELVVFVGPSGCGKSTLLRIIAGIEELTDGEVWIGDKDVRDVDPASRGVAMVFQTYALYPHMSVEENMAFALKMAKRPKAEIRERVARAAEILHLKPYLKRRPKELSGGQRQRVAIGRAIVREPEVFLFDEPLSNLDAELRVQMRIELSKLHSDLQATMIYVTHDQVEAMTLADKIVVLNDGRIEQVGVPLDLYQRPANLFVAGFIGAPKMNFLKAEVVETTSDRIEVGGADLHRSFAAVRGSASPMLAPKTALTLGVRPEHLRIGEVGKGISTLIIEVAENLGEMTYLHGTTPTGNRITISMKGFQNYRYSDAVGISFDADKAHLFDNTGMRVDTQETNYN
ncbi:MAG: sn-glycerol-3-phosphate ABC transporter ATP-binding protein UgpC [Verrucomicrobia bacterium]|nr:sn-glycerol-3-phosphate ABC transporter ATP-binding protein UgpC [Verrucomicrobiota bacterium]MBV9674325.1 sn-glycerol-3-phosphate ABC transporter ATP-binding protein UgpC [Verrucomicrobiota bacterium]